MEWKRMFKDWSLALVAAAAVYLAMGWFRGKPDLPEFAPDFSVNTLDGQVVNLEKLKGQTVVVNFWASWCGPCRAEIPVFSKFAGDHPDIKIYGLAVESGTPAEVSKLAQQLGISYPVAIAPGAMQAAYDVSTLPTTIVVAPDGRIKTAYVGAMSYRDLESAVLD